jgi:hypothetical protein
LTLKSLSSHRKLKENPDVLMQHYVVIGICHINRNTALNLGRGVPKERQVFKFGFRWLEMAIYMSKVHN